MGYAPRLLMKALEARMSDDLTMNAYLHAIEAERAAWAALDKRLPGRPGFSPPRWTAWVDAVADLKLEAERCIAQRGAVAGLSPSRATLP
jgi:hypothetical protein